ncbi:membrane dipeptidase [Croceifilum oryzae]|uniref:Membrane dipeptidase n=1 Tax=Croceifilum oryzae TaxID=1553429 RepID=A0AAJ1WS35_9BACL|nr:dipeptidase [Croceifilum oryzae]MDQ0416933.1 membrane dipeptidase [Croceifilum oryzae]
MWIIDGHCDVLLKLWNSPDEHDFYEENSTLDVSYHGLCSANGFIQNFAVFVPPRIPVGQRFLAAAQQIDIFYQKVLQDQSKMVLITNREELDRLRVVREIDDHAQMGAILSLEGADALQGEIAYLRLFHRLGVRSMGLTWNYANEVADGVQEVRNGGITRFGHQVLEEMKKLKMICDVSHLSIRSFWDVMEYTDLAVMASHSNTRALCPHVRNLEDDQIRALIQKEGMIGVTFVPYFVHQPSNESNISHVIRHIEHICELGGADHIMFGSDFDGIEEKVTGLETAKQYTQFIHMLLQYYPSDLVEKWAWKRSYVFYSKAFS